MTTARELLKEARDMIDAFAQSFDWNNGGAQLCARINNFLSQPEPEPLTNAEIDWRQQYHGIVDPPIAQPEPAARPCTCHPDDNPPVPCPQKFALSECRAAAPAPDAELLRSELDRAWREVDFIAKVERIMELADTFAESRRSGSRTSRGFVYLEDRAALRAEVERLANLDYRGAYEALEQQFVELMQRAETAERDAERYQWLVDWLTKKGLLSFERDVSPELGVVVDCWVLWKPHSVWRSDPVGWGEESQTAAIDAAIAQEKP